MNVSTQEHLCVLGLQFPLMSPISQFTLKLFYFLMHGLGLCLLVPVKWMLFKEACNTGPSPVLLASVFIDYWYISIDAHVAFDSKSKRLF